jgi:uncharacterized protein YdaU (DUF1376 family)
MSLPWFKVYPRQYLTDSKLKMLTREQKSILMDLWCYCAEDGSIPSDVDDLACLLGESRDCIEKSMQKLSKFFIEEEGRLYSKRLREESISYYDKCQKLRESASKGGLQKVANAKANANGEFKQMLKQMPSEEEGEEEKEKETTPTPSAPLPGPEVVEKPKRSSRVEILGAYPKELVEAMDSWRSLLKTVKDPEIQDTFPPNKRFLASGIGTYEAAWSAWKKRTACRLASGQKVTDENMLAAVQLWAKAKLNAARSGDSLAVPMLATLINSPAFVDGLIRASSSKQEPGETKPG